DLVLMGTASSFKFYQTPSEDNKLSAMRALELLDIVKFKNRNFSHLSGGEQQLVLIARAIAQGNKILLMDEPCSSLDYGNQIKILQKLKMLAREGYLIFLTSHNPMHAYMFADNVLLLNNGVVEGYGNPKDVLKKKVIKNIFDVEVDIMNVGNKNFCVPNLRGEYDEF
ncbi:MAG: ABC transporter ATP-binding protein, partial [Clostridia bacterium]